jgi:5-methylcytosine-specific restriction endonuclease McrA
MSRVKKETDRFYDRRLWRDKLRPMVLRRDPICVICIANGDTPPKPSTVADHKIAFANASTTAAAWDLFTDLNNLQGICERHHDEKTATSDHGFGNRSRAYIPQRRIAHTGAEGPQFISGSMPQHVLDRALNKGLDDLLQFAKSEAAEPKAETE